MKRLALPGMTLGATSFLLPADYVPALRFAAPLCEDIALLLLECGAQGEYLPAAQDVDQMAAVLEATGSRLHVHLPTASDCSSAESTRDLVNAVRMAVARSAPLQPHSFVLHVDFACLRQHRTGKRRNRRMDPAMLTAEQRLWTRDALDQIADLLPDPRQLAIENLEGFCPDFWDQWLEDRPFSRCADIGHLWKDHENPVPWLERWLPRLRGIHLHGLRPRHTTPPFAVPVRSLSDFGPQPRDHGALDAMPTACIDAVMHRLWRSAYRGVLTLEVFSLTEFLRSRAVLLRSWKRYCHTETCHAPA